MQVVLLAAGLGSRLGELTRQLPKALIDVAGESLLVHATRFARRLSPREIIVVGGFGFADVATEIERRDLKVTLLENPSFRDGNLVSLMAAHPRIHGDFLLMNVDHIYRPAIAARVAPSVDEVTAFIDQDRKLGADDMKIERDAGGRVRSIAKTLTVFDCGYVGMTRVPGDALDRYFTAADAVSAAEGRAVHVERVLARLAASERPPACRDISGVGWLEVDVPDERQHADNVIRQEPDDWR
jgi:choline kinase